MKTAPSAGFRLFGLCTLVWTALWCGDLPAAWRHAPYDRAGAAAMALWATAAALAPRQFRPARRWLAAAWLGSFVGVAGELHVAQHAALVGAVAAWLPANGWRIAFSVTAVSWMPAFGWALAGCTPAAVNGARLLLSAAVLTATAAARWRSNPVTP